MPIPTRPITSSRRPRPVADGCVGAVTGVAAAVDSGAAWTGVASVAGVVTAADVSVAAVAGAVVSAAVCTFASAAGAIGCCEGAAVLAGAALSDGAVIAGALTAGAVVFGGAAGEGCVLFGAAACDRRAVDLRAVVEAGDVVRARGAEDPVVVALTEAAGVLPRSASAKRNERVSAVG